MKPAILVFSSICLCLTGWVIQTAPPRPTSIARIKAIQRSNSLIEEFSKKDVYVEGYYYNDPIPLLITDLKWTRINSIMPDSVYLALPNTNDMTGKLKTFLRQKIRIKGKINTKNNTANFAGTHADFIPNEIKLVGVPRKSAFASPKNMPLNPKFTRQFTAQIGNSPNYAILYSGGYNQANAKIRYWKDLKLMYQNLKMACGYDVNHIIVIYKDGKGEDKDIPVNFSADKNGLSAAFKQVNAKITISDDLFLFFTNHGGGYNNVSHSNEGGVKDISGDEINPYHVDETVYFYGQTDNTLLDDNVAALLNTVQCNKLITLMEPCYGGGFLRDLRGRNRIIISASSEFDVSYSASDEQYDAFSYFFTTAFNTRAADLNNDGKVSVLEAFLYARSQDNTGEAPELEDNGDGVGSTNPGTAGSKDGALSKITFLNKPEIISLTKTQSR
jgi:hypothetical protein